MIRNFGPPQVMKIVEEVDLLDPVSGQVRATVLAAAKAFTDTIRRKEKYPDGKD